MKPKPTQRAMTTRYAAGVVGILLLSLLIFVLIMKPPMLDFGLMVVFLLISAILSSMVGYAAYRLGWMTNVRTIRLTLLISSIISSILTFLNVWLTARLMFASQHDLLLATVLLLFAGGMTMVMGYFLSSTITERIIVLQQAANQLAAGERDTRIDVSGRDEVAELSNAFNRMADQLQEAEQNRADLIAWVSHDLQTPLTSIQAILEALKDGLIEEPESQQRYLETAQREVKSLSALIDDLFQMAQIDAGGMTLDRSDNSIRDLISDTLETFSHIARKSDIHLEGSIQPGIDIVNIDVQRIGRVLNNLIGNALRYTPPGGKVKIEVNRKDEQIEVHISDTGEGIQPDDLPYIFDRFYRGEKSRSRKTGGAGLGLAISRGIIQAHGGEIWVESTLGKGTTFIFTL
ncbi:MAG TPA: ATP-binding protein [Anaerolineales bacterium]|nr:ATP-binding protein [Anaerolineales bacterium]